MAAGISLDQNRVPEFIWTTVTGFQSPGGFIYHQNVFIIVQEAKV